ncbi:MAG: hypothetical protein PUE46_07155 [Eubacteriales bacterium]|nr:hypothetical protein [Eubacteriales bacterium]
MSKNRIEIYMDDKHLRMCDSNIERFNAKNRSDLIETALEHLIVSKDSETISNILIPSLESSIRAAVRDSEHHISSMLFKLAVEIDMMMHVTAATNEIDEGILNKLRGECVQEVKSSLGRINFDSAVRIQKG